MRRFDKEDINNLISEFAPIVAWVILMYNFCLLFEDKHIVAFILQGVLSVAYPLYRQHVSDLEQELKEAKDKATKYEKWYKQESAERRIAYNLLTDEQRYVYRDEIEAIYSDEEEN